MRKTEEKDENLQGMLDALTGIYNRKGFYQYTKELIETHPETQFCIAYWNIRRFKVANNMFGWHTGDRILIQFAESVKNALRGETATYGRMERDNFICCIPIDMVYRSEWVKIGDIKYAVGDMNYHFSCCCGLYKITDPALPLSEMGDKARLAMEKIKDNYMCSTTWFDEAMWESIMEEQRLSSEFQTAIAEKQFKVYYQPVCKAEDGRVTSAEALVRWLHPKRGLISPGVFIPLFEKNGYISILDRYVWSEVCRMLRESLDAGMEVVPISINVSRVEFYNYHLCEDIRNIVKSYDLSPDLIKIEITETAYSDNPGQVQEAVSKLHEYGFVVLMDDFGSGYSSLNILKDLPIDILKIDMKFLDSFETSQKSAIILEAVIRMAKWMKLRVVAEGVEDRKEWNYLKSVECDLVQGFYFYRPMPEEDFISLLKQMGDKNVLAQLKDEASELENTIADVLRGKNLQNNDLFYDMLGGMGVLEMTEDTLEIIQVNRSYYEVIYNTSEGHNEEISVLNKEVDESVRGILMEKCRLAKEKKEIQQAQIHHRREDGSYVWLGVKLRYVGRQGKRSLFYFAIDNIDAMKKLEDERHLFDYSAALMKVFDKVYRLDYETGLGEVLHTTGVDEMQVRETYYFFDFFDKFADHIEWLGGEEAGSIIRDKARLEEKLSESKNSSYSVTYKATLPNGDVQVISALFFKVKMQSGEDEYLCCIKRN